MSIQVPQTKSALSAERKRTAAAEAEVVRLRAQLEAITEAATSAQIPSFDAVQELARVVGHLKQVEKELEDQQDLVRQVINTSPNLIYVEDAKGGIILANKSYAHILSWLSSRSRADEPLAAGVPAPDRQTENGETYETATTFEECYHLMDGQTRWYHTTQSPLMRSDGSRYLLSFSSDITELKRANRVAEESVHAKQVFMANMSHEIRTPLHGVMGLADLIKKGPLSAEQADYVDMIQSSTENLLVVINDILDFAKIESGKINLENIPFDLIKTVQDAVRSLTFKSDEKGVVLRILGLNENLPLAQGDPYRLRQVLVNLISNAIKFTEQGAITITIDASQRSGTHLPVTFSVADTGIGISAENLSTVFSSFQQGDSSVPRLYGGTGLGLTICKNLVELQGGEIGVRSEPGQGSCFYFTIPYTVSNEQPAKEHAVIQQPDLLRGLNILFAEDNAVNQLIGVSMLSQWQVKVDMAQNGEEALHKAWQRKYDLILMDIQMPQMNGFEATSRLRAEQSPNRNTPVIALTADAIRVNERSCESLGFNDFLTKPYSELALYNIIAKVSQRSKSPLAPVDVPIAASDLGLRYDFAMLGRLATDQTFIRKMLELFINRVPGQVKTLQLAVEQDDWQTVAHEAHSLKSTFGSLNIQPEVGNLKMVEELAELQAPKAEILPFVNAIAKGTELFSALFIEELAKMSAEQEA
ncbi:ATP-binding protein [Hymenobacter sp. B1770]|uniref:ATP-binding protein n=1 Tax=Hymenobacter sp. B1770 TaxID=1718788 RepID=UPI003CF73509